jgi:large subunit ribosomal protein L11
MSKKLIALVKLALQAGKANPAPPIGPALGPYGLNISSFCKEYNSRTEAKKDLIIPVEISIFDDKSFTFILKTPPASILLAKAAKMKKGSATPNTGIIGSITTEQLKEISRIKLPDLNAKNLISAMKIIEGTARNMGISIIY